MSDSGKININSDFTKPSAPKAKASETSPQPSAKASTSSNKGADIYKAATNSQHNLKLNPGANPVEKELGSKLDFEIRHKNPILFEQLKNSKDLRLPPSTKEKQPPPDPSLRVKLSPKGYPINPRKVKAQIPGRLNPHFDNGVSAFDRLALTLGDQTSINLNKLYSDSALKDYMSTYQSSSIAELLNLEYSIFNQETKFVTDFLSARAELLSEDQFLYDFLQNIINILEQSQNPIQHILQLYLPFPLPFVVKDLDLEFEEDEKELYEDCDDDAKGDSDDSETELEDEEDSNEVSLSVTTLNYNKMHFLIKFTESSNEAKVFIKGDTSSSELSIPVEMGIDDALYGEVDHIEFQNSLWRKPVPLEINDRYLKIRHKGKLDSRMISVTRKILETIADNDYNEDSSSEML